MKTVPQLYQDVMATRDAVAAKLLLVPSAPYSCCGLAGRNAYDDLSSALCTHRAAVKLWRFAKSQAKRRPA
jgi:hypothetical protein